MQKIYEIENLSEPPFRFPIGADAIDVIKKEVKSIMEDTEKYEGWSEGLVFNDEKYPAQYA